MQEYTDVDACLCLCFLSFRAYDSSRQKSIPQESTVCLCVLLKEFFFIISIIIFIFFFALFLCKKRQPNVISMLHYFLFAVRATKIHKQSKHSRKDLFCYTATAAASTIVYEMSEMLKMFSKKSYFGWNFKLIAKTMRSIYSFSIFWFSRR